MNFLYVGSATVMTVVAIMLTVFYMNSPWPWINAFYIPAVLGACGFLWFEALTN